jgi:hypothetical protein
VLKIAVSEFLMVPKVSKQIGESPSYLILIYLSCCVKNALPMQKMELFLNRVGKNPGFKKKPSPVGFFWVCLVFFGFFVFFWFFWVFFALKRGF